MSFVKVIRWGKFPTLTDGDVRLFDSALICEYIDHLYCEQGNASLFGKGTTKYFEIQKNNYQANGMLDASVSSVLELRRETEQSQFWLERWKTALKTSIERASIHQLGSAAKPQIQTLTWACALGHLDFRFHQYNWRVWNAELADWFTSIEKTDWFVETDPS